MLIIPEIGFRLSVTQSNVDSNVSADWIEANILFDGRELSKADVVDVLIENQICANDDQDMAHLIADEGWQEVERRRRWGGVPDTVEVTAERIAAREGWEDDVVRAFLVMLAIQRIFPDWAAKWQKHVEQGNLFEKVVEAICPALLPGWTTYRAGWSPDDTKRVPEIVAALCDRVHSRGAVDLDQWVGPTEKDGGLDLVCYRSFPDEREAIPMFLLQCASGKNWRNKVAMPNAYLWSKYLNSAVQPSTGIVAPFVITDQELRKAGLVGQAIVFDRIRVVGAARVGEVALSPKLVEEVTAWMKPRVEALPRAS